MKKKKNEKYLKIIVPLILSLIFVLILWLGYRIIFKTKEKTFLNKIDTSVYANITHEAIYGIHLNFKGTFTLPENITEIKLILSNGKNEIEIPTEQQKEENRITFTTSDFINKGMNLEFLPQGIYYLILKGKKINEKNEEEWIYYSVENKTDYKDLEYYTITKNGKNNKIEIEWNTYEECPTLRFKIEETKLPEDVYDITIDPGHGGFDVGAIGKYNNETYYESELTLDISLKLKEYLEQLGYKVAITRTENTDVDIYSENGRATLANQTKSKFNFAIHHNSFEYIVDYLKGIEIYVANDSEFDLANLLINHITKEAHTTISPKETYQVSPGIYQRFFTEQEILEDDVQPSKKTTNTIYYYFLREVGGISTNATNDGSYKNYPKNPYYNSNNTAESVLLELGYINNPTDLENLLKNKNEYAKAIGNALKEYLEQNH